MGPRVSWSLEAHRDGDIHFRSDTLSLLRGKGSHIRQSQTSHQRPSHQELIVTTGLGTSR